MKIIGIDPGLADTGIGIIAGNGRIVNHFSFGGIKTAAQTALATRLNRIFLDLNTLLRDEKPDLAVIEDVFSLGKFPKSGITLGQVSGVILLAAEQAGVSTIQVPVREAKQVLTGNGNASKQQLEKAVRDFLKWPAPIRPYHASDALGLALIGLFRYT